MTAPTSRMEAQRVLQAFAMLAAVLVILEDVVDAMNPSEKRSLRDKVVEMFNHGYFNYMEKAYPADELMPLSCKGRYRGSEPSRGDVDDVLGNFSVTLVDSLDTLAVLGHIEEFERAVQLVIQDVNFDNDIVVSVFETNIRVLGGLLGGHVMAEYFKKSGKGMVWYSGELLDKAKDIGYRLLPAFNTTTGIPFPRVNLKHGVNEQSRTGHEKDTCTSCAGTLILEMAALSRLTGENIFEHKAAKALDILWEQRHRVSDLVGLVINVHNGNWVRRESGVGAGIDSYYEYLLKAYILLGDENYLDRFNQHYEAVMKYISQGPLMLDVHMHKPLTNSRNFMDSLLAFWPGLQVLKGDIRPAIETHEMLYQVMQRHNFLPEAFTADFRVHWGQHPLRPEFVESTYFLYKATNDPHYLDVGKTILENLDQHARVECGFAAIKDVTTGAHEDQMDSFVLAETFKYLFLLFSEEEDLILPVDNYIFTTEAHLLPLSLSIFNSGINITKDMPPVNFVVTDEEEERRTCPNTNYLFPGDTNYVHSVRSPLKNMVESLCPKPRSRRRARLRAMDFVAGNKDQLEELHRMGIRIATMKDGRVQLLHTASEASSPEDAEDGMLFMQEMIELSKVQQQEVQQEPRVVQFITPPYFGQTVFTAGPAQFGYDLKNGPGVQGYLAEAEPFRACQPMENAEFLFGKIVVMERGECMFIDKARNIQAVGAVGGIVIDNAEGTTSSTSPLFAMSGDGKNDVHIPLVFLFSEQGRQLREAIAQSQQLEVYMGFTEKRPDEVMQELLDKQEAKHRAAQQAQSERSLQEDSGQFSQKDPQSEDQSCGSGTQDVVESEVEVDAAKLLLQKYMKKMKLGDLQVQLKQNFRITEDTEKLLTIIEGPNNARQVSMPLDELVTGEAERKITLVYEELVNLLMSHTNFPNLNEQNLYLQAIGDLVEAAFTEGKTALKSESQGVLDKLADELRANNEEEGNREEHDNGEEEEGEKYLHANVEEQTGRSEVTHPDGLTEDGGKHYATAEELDELNSRLPDSFVIKEAPEWMGLKKGEVYEDKNGVFYSTAMKNCGDKPQNQAHVDKAANAWSLKLEEDQEEVEQEGIVSDDLIPKAVDADSLSSSTVEMSHHIQSLPNEEKEEGNSGNQNGVESQNTQHEWGSHSVKLEGEKEANEQGLHAVEEIDLQHRQHEKEDGKGERTHELGQEDRVEL